MLSYQKAKRGNENNCGEIQKNGEIPKKEKYKKIDIDTIF